MNYKNINIELLEHDSVRITTNKNHYIYIDPFQLPTDKALPKADVLLISHTHQDHCSIEDIKKIIQSSTHVFTVPDAVSKLTAFHFKDIHLIKPGTTVSFDDSDHEIYEITAVPAYNIDKFRSPGIPFHPKDFEFVGIIIDIDGTTVYFAGDTDHIPEMKTLPSIDIAFLPVSGTYVMTAQEAAKAAQDIKATITVPMHYGSIIGSEKDAQEFKTLAEQRGIKVEIIK